jgi:hypothetical protein
MSRIYTTDTIDNVFPMTAVCASRHRQPGARQRLVRCADVSGARDR